MAENQKRVLIVDDDASLLEHLVVSLASYRSLSFKTALNGLEAIEVIEAGGIDLVVTDIQMPKMDGFGLVSHISRRFPRLPVIIITGHATPSMEHKLSRMGIVSFERKPVEIDALAERIFDLLVGVDSGYVQGISIPSFLQVLQADRKSCSLKVTDGHETGYLHLVNGQVRDAEFKGMKGTLAAMEIIGWDALITIDIQPVVRLKETTIQQDLTFLIMETLRQKDEGDAGERDELSDGVDDFVLPVRNSIPPAVRDACAPCHCENVGTPIAASDLEDVVELFDCSLQRLFDVKGYQASAILTQDGEPLALHAKKAQTDELFVAKNVHNMFCALQKSAAQLGMGPLEESVFRSRDGLVLVRCNAEAGQPHLHVMAVFKGAEGEGLMRIRLKRVSEESAEYAMPTPQRPCKEEVLSEQSGQ